MSAPIHYLAPLSLLLAMAAPLASADGETQELAGYWRFDEAEGLTVKDASGKGRDGQILNNSQGAKRVAGRNGGAIEFTGDDEEVRGQAGCIDIPGFENIDWATGLTIELWVRFTNLYRPNTYELVSNTVSDRGTGFRFMLTWASLCLRSGEGDAGTTWAAASDPSAIAIKTGEWYHLAATYDGSAFRVYVDGELAGESAQGLELTPGLNTICVGSYRSGYAYGLDGIVDDLKLYNYPRSPAQIVMDAKLSE